MRREGGKGIPRLDHASTGFQIRIKRGYSSFKENNCDDLDLTNENNKIVVN